MRSLSILLVSAVLALSLICFSGCGKSVEDTRSEESQTVTEAQETDEETYGEHGVLTSVTYTAAGADSKEDNFSYFVSETEEGKYTLRAIYCDSEGNSYTAEADIEASDMFSLRGIFDKYGYEKLIGNAAEPDPGILDDVPDAPNYYFSATYADGSFFNAGSAGDGAAELMSFFKDLVEKYG